MPMIGARIRELRQNRGVTLEQVAQETGLSISFLSMLERDKVSVSVDNLERLARYFSVRLVQFFQGIEDDEVVVTRAQQVNDRCAGQDPRQSLFFLLADRQNARMEPMLIRVGAGHGDPHFRSHDGDALLYVVEGSIRLLTEKGESVELAAGDSAYYAGFPARRIENASRDQPALILMVTTPPTTMRDDVIDPRRGLLIQSEEE